MRTRMRLVTGAAGVSAVAQFGPAVIGCPGVTAQYTRRMNLLPASEVLLTIDDGPHPKGTAAVLNRLAALGVPALFFLVGEQLEAHPDLGRRIVAEGHDVGVHGWDHRPLPLTNPASASRGIRRTAEAVAAVCGCRPRWYRPPYGVATGTALTAARRADLTPLWWTRWGRDWSRGATPSSITGAILGDSGLAVRGEILLLHDSDSYGTPGSWRRTAAALDGIVEAIRARGQTFVTTAALRHRQFRMPTYGTE